MKISDLYNQKSNTYYCVSMYLLMLSFFTLIYSLITTFHIISFVAIIFLMILSVIFFQFSGHYRSKSVNCTTGKVFNDNTFLVQFLNGRVATFQLFAEDGLKRMEIKEKDRSLLSYLAPVKIDGTDEIEVSLNDEIFYFVNLKSSSLKFSYNNQSYHLTRKHNKFTYNKDVYVWKERMLLFDFELRKGEELVLTGVQGKMKVKTAETFQNPNMPSIQFASNLEEIDKFKIIGILLLKWSNKYS